MHGGEMLKYCGKCKEQMVKNPDCVVPAFYKCPDCGNEIYEVSEW